MNNTPTPTPRVNDFMTPENTDTGSHHPLVLRLLEHAENPFIIYTPSADDIELAAKLIQEQHDGISKALEAALDGELESCIHLLMVVSNEYPFTQNDQVELPPSGGS